MLRGSGRYKSSERVDFDRSSKIDLDRSSKIDFDNRERADLDRAYRRDNDRWNRSFNDKEKIGAFRNRTEPPTTSISTDQPKVRRASPNNRSNPNSRR